MAAHLQSMSLQSLNSELDYLVLHLLYQETEGTTYPGWQRGVKTNRERCTERHSQGQRLTLSNFLPTVAMTVVLLVTVVDPC